MSVIIRLQNLPWSANALDIRAFFRGLSIPDGGVHIVGGEMGDAFIAFSTDEDARQAMSMDRGKLNEVQVRLLLSSRAEMQKVIEVARNKSLSMQMQRSQQQNQQITLPAPQPPVITSTTLKHIMSNPPNQLSLNPMQQYQSYNQTLNLENSQDSRDSRSDNTGDGKSRSRNRSKDRRSSMSPSRGRDRRRSTSRGRDSRRRGRDRSRSRSRSRDRKNSRRRRSRSRDRGNNERTRWDKDSRDRDGDRKDIDKDIKKLNDSDVSVVTDKEVEQPPIPPPNSTKLNLWNPSGNPLFPPGIMQGYTTISQNMQQQQIQTPVYQTNISAGYQSANQFNSQMFPQFNKPPPVDGSINLTEQQNKFQNMLNLNNNGSQGNNGVNFNNLNSNNAGLQNTFNSTSFNPTGINSPQQTNQQISTDIMNSLSGVGNKLTSFSGIFSSQNKKIDDNNKQINDPRIQNSSNMMMNKSNNNNNQNDLQKNYGDINFDELRGNCIKISNMCPSTSYSDIRRFFSGLFIANNGIKMINDKHGLRIGVAYVRFVRPESKPKAFIRNGSPLKSKKILIESVTEDEFDEEIDSYKPVRRFDNNRYGNDDRPPPHIPLRGDMDNSSPLNTGEESLSGVDNKSQAQNLSQSSKPHGESIVDDDDEDDGNDNPDNKKEENEQPFTILKLDDVPVFAKEYDIMKMFSSFTIIDILLAKNEDNKRFLKCYVKFHLSDDAKAALKNKSLHIIGHKQIYVSSCSEDKFNEVKEKLNQPEIIEESIEDIDVNNESQKQENVNDISYDPYNPNIQERFDNTNEDKDNKQYDNNSDDNQNLNDNNSNFMNNNNSTSNNSINNNNRNNNQPPSLLNLPPLGRLDTNLDPRRRDNKPSRFNNNSNNSSDNKMMNKNMKRFVLLKNCEYKLNKRDYAEFFATINLVPQRIEIIRNKRNQPCGECIVEFQDDIEAEKAFIKNNTLLAGRTCRMETIPVNLAAEKLCDDSIRIGNDNNNSGFMSNNMFGNNNRDNMFQNQQNDNFRNNNNTFRQNRIDDRGGIGLDNFDNRNNNNRVGNRPSRFSDNDGSNNNSGRMMGGGNNFNMNMNMRRGNGDLNNMPPINNSSIDQFGQPGSVVGLKNVPYKAVTEDILDFFGNFKLGPQNVIRRYNDDGAPTGDARVAFNSPMEARAAIEQMRNCKIFNRQVYLSIV